MKCLTTIDIIKSTFKHWILIIVLYLVVNDFFKLYSCSHHQKHHKVYRRQEKPNKLKYEINHGTDCEVISHPDAKINECGFCVGGSTGLNIDHGKDCQGICFGNATIDCMGVCGGDAYEDECSQACIQPSFEIHNNSPLSSTNRDCRGLCLQPVKESGSGPVPVPTQVYMLDQCGLCSLSQAPTSSSAAASLGDHNLNMISSTSPSTLSQSLDCAGNCQLPGFTKHFTKCGKCIRPNELLSVIDNCGNCLAEGHPCSCDRDPVRCGCIDQNNCYLIKSLSPLALPNKVAVNISIVGYFYPYVNQLYCVIRSQAFEIIESFPVQFLHKNKTFIQCTVQLEQSGEYVVGLGFRENVLITPPKDLLQLYVFDSGAVNITSIEPKKSLSNDSHSRLEIKFHDENNELPPVPINCKIIFEDGKEELGDFGLNQNSCILKESSLRAKSQVIKIYPTFDGLNLISSGFDHLIEAPAPKIFALSSFISEDSLSVIVNFDKSVDIETIEYHLKDHSEDPDDLVLAMCDYLLMENTIEHLSLFGLQGCKWATRIQLIISIIKPFPSDAIVVQIKEQVLSEYDQKYPLFNNEMSVNVSKLSNSLNWWSYEPMIAITGPNEISLCGDFALIGHYSSPRGTTDIEFQWEVGGEVSIDLRQYIKFNGKSTTLLLNAEMFEIGAEYEFKFRAFIRARRQTIEATHTLIRLDYEAPNLAIHSTTLLNNIPLHENDPVVLVADFKIPDCIYPPQLIHLFWKTNDPRILFPIKQISKRHSGIFHIDPYSVPANHSATISVNAFIGFYQNQTSKAVFRFKPIAAQLKGNPANGINRITIGSQSGLLTITSNNNLRAKRFVYQWSCHETKSGQPCYFNFASAPVGYQRDPILITREIQTKKNLILNSTAFQPNNQYLIGLQVFDANDSRQSSETDYILLNVVEGLKPQVFVGPVYIQGKYQVPYNTRFSTFVIPSGSSIVIQGYGYLKTGLKSINWQSSTFRYPLSWSNKRVSEQKIETELFIHQDTLVAYGTYNFKLEACSFENECSWSEITLMSAQSTTMCNVVVDSFVELEMTLAIIDRCNKPPSASPITYQLFFVDDIHPQMLPLTVPQLSPVIFFVGTPTLSNLVENQLTQLIVKVCDRFETCTMHHSQPVRVANASNLTQSIQQLINQAKRLYRTGDTIVALSYLNAIFLKSDIENENRDLYEQAINSTIEFATTALQLPNLILNSGHYELMFSTFSHALHKTENLQLQRKLLNLINRYFEKAESHKTMPSINNIRIIYSNVMNSFAYGKTTANNSQEFELYLKDIRETFRQMKKAVASQISLGSRVVLEALRSSNTETISDNNSKIHTAYTEILHSRNVEDVYNKAQMFPNETITAKVQFGQEIRQMFNQSWNCNRKLPCTSVIQAITVFPNESPFPNNKNAHKLSPIIDITIHAPYTGQEQHIRGRFKASVFELSVTGNETYGGPDYSTRCHYFDEFTQQWRLDDIHPLGIAYNQAACWSGHLSSFVVLRIVIGITVDYVLGILVVCTLGVLVFGMMVVFYVQRKQEVTANAKAAKEKAEATAAAASTETSNMNRIDNDDDDEEELANRRNHQRNRIEFAKAQRRSNNRKATAKVSAADLNTEIQSQTILVTD